MKFVVPALLSLVLGDFNQDISAAQSMATRFSTQFVSWQNEDPVSDYTAHADRLGGNSILPYFSKLNAGLKSGASPAQIEGVQEFDAVIAAALDAAVEYTRYICDSCESGLQRRHGPGGGGHSPGGHNGHGGGGGYGPGGHNGHGGGGGHGPGGWDDGSDDGSNDNSNTQKDIHGVNVVGYYNVLYPAFSSQVSLIGSVAAASCSAYQSSNGGIGSLSSAFSYIKDAQVTSYLCDQTMSPSSYGELPSVTQAASCTATPTATNVQSCVLRNDEGIVTATSSVAL